MKCLDDNLIAEFLDGTLAPEVANEIELHMDDCAECRRLVSKMAKFCRSNEWRILSIGKEKTIPELPWRYKIHGEFGRGGQARIMLAFDESIGREIALKELLSADEIGEDSPFLMEGKQRSEARFLKEARITGQLEHPGIVPVYEIGQREDGRLFYTMQLVRGKTLKQVLEESKDLRARMRHLGHFLNLCQTIAYAHSRNVVHRDIKTSNVMVGEFGETLLLDWGLAKFKDEPEGLEPYSITKTPDGTVLGTPAYMSPEQAFGRVAEVDERSDVYSLGCVLYEILTGQPPISDKPLHEVIEDIQKGRYHPVLSRCPKAPPELAAVAEKALSLKKVARYQSASELADEISSFMTGGRVMVYEYNPWELMKRLAPHRITVLMATFMAAILAALFILLFQYLNAS